MHIVVLNKIITLPYINNHELSYAEEELKIQKAVAAFKANKFTKVLCLSISHGSPVLLSYNTYFARKLP